MTTKQGIPRHSPKTPTPANTFINSLLSEDGTFLRVVAGELLLICALYALIKCMISTSHFDVIFPRNLHETFSKAPIYIVVQLSGCCLWIFFAVLLHGTYSEDALHEASAPFICHFQIKQMARVHEFAVQCIDAGVFGLRSAVSINVGLCVVIAFSKLVHLVAIFGIQPLLKVNKVAAKMAERKLIQSIDEVGLRFGLSDLYFAIIVTGRDVTQQMKPKPEEKKEIPLYNSRPPSMVC